MRVLCTTAAMMLLAMASCAPAATPRGLDDAVPARRLSALRDAARRADTTPETLMRIVEQLDSDDVLVRISAIETLERLTGERRGYDPVAPVTAREIAIERWVESLAPGPASPPGDAGHG